MKRCPECGRTFTNNTLTNCLNDGAGLVEDAPDTVSYYGAPQPESLPPSSPEDTASTYSTEPSSPWSSPEAAPPNYAAPPPNYAAPPPNYAAPPPNYAAPPAYFATPQKSSVQVPWRRIGLACFVILGIVRLGLHFVQSQQTPPSLIGSTPINMPDNTPDLFPSLKLDKTLTDTPDAALRSRLISTIKEANASEAKAYSKLDPAPLHSFHDGPALAAALGEMKALKTAGTTREERLTAQTFHTFSVNPEQTKAEVDEIETWDTITRSAASGKVTSKNLSNVDPQVVSLKRTAQGWKVENVQFYGLQ